MFDLGSMDLGGYHLIYLNSKLEGKQDLLSELGTQMQDAGDLSTSPALPNARLT